MSAPVSLLPTQLTRRSGLGKPEVDERMRSDCNLHDGGVQTWLVTLLSFLANPSMLSFTKAQMQTY